MNSSDPKARYIVTSTPGMTPYASCATRREAEKIARKARRMGLDGQVVKLQR